MKLRFSARRARYWAGRIGLSGAAGLFLAVAAAAGAQAWLGPLQADAAALRQEVAATRQKLLAAAAQRGALAPVTEEEKLGAFYALLPAPEAAFDLLGRIYAHAAAQHVRLGEGEYTHVRSKDLASPALRIVLPVRASYPQIRKFIGACLAELPTLALENVTFRRDKVADEVVEAKITLLLYLGRAT